MSRDDHDRRIDGDDYQNEFYARSHIMVDETSSLCLIKELILCGEALDEWFQNVDSDEEDDHACDSEDEARIWY